MQIIGWALYVIMFITLFTFTGSVVYFASIQFGWCTTFVTRGEKYAEEYRDYYKNSVLKILVIGVISLIIGFCIGYSLENYNYDVDFKKYGIQLNGYRRK